MAQQKSSNVQRNVLPTQETRGGCGYTVIPPKEKNRLKMQSIADKETKDFEAFKQKNRPYFNIVKTLGSGEPQELNPLTNMSAKPKKSESKQGPKKPGDKAPEKEKRKESLTKLKKDDKSGPPSPGGSVLDSGATAIVPGADPGAKDECPPPTCCEPICQPCCDACCMTNCDLCEDENRNENDACGGQQQDSACDNNACDRTQNSDECEDDCGDEDDFGEQSLTLLQCRFPYVEPEVLEELLRQTGNNVEIVEELLSV